jgi:hypothetical protein
MSKAKEILERALEAGGGYGTPQMYETRIHEALAALDAEGVGLPWVSVEERLPHPDDFVFCVNRFGMHEAWFGHDNVWRVRGHADAAIPDVTHWLPLSAIPLPGQSPDPSAGLRKFACGECGASATSTVGYVRCDAPACGMRVLRADEEQSNEQ